MTSSTSPENAIHAPVHPVRFITATSLFDGHDAAINIMRRILQSQGAEVIHLGHNRSVDEVVTAAIHEDVQGIAISSYQGGHVEYFAYLVERLRDEGLGHVKVYGGGGGVIVAEDIEKMYASGVHKVFTPEDGATLGLTRMINQLIEECDVDPVRDPTASLDPLAGGSPRELASLITILEAGALDPDLSTELRSRAGEHTVPVLGITGTGGSGKSSLTDELIRRVRLDFQDKMKVAVIAVDPTRRRGGGALLGDRIRMNALDSPTVFFRSLATRGSSEVPECLDDVVAACKVSGADLVIIETPGIGQGDAAIIDHADLSLYVMTPEFGAASQLEKIDMLDLADVIAINKYDRRGGADALRDVRRQVLRNREAFDSRPEDMPVFGTVAARVNDDGVTALYGELADRLVGLGLAGHDRSLPRVEGKTSTSDAALIAPGRAHYLLEVSDTVRTHHATTDAWVEQVRLARALRSAAEHLAQTTPAQTNPDRANPGRANPGRTGVGAGDGADQDAVVAATAAEAQRLEDALPTEARSLLDNWRRRAAQLAGDEVVISDTADRSRSIPLIHRSLADLPIRRVSLPRFDEDGDLLRWLRGENLPGHFPFTAGVFPFKRDDEDPTRMFAGEGDAFRTNRRFHLLAEGTPATRLSTAFDSVTLYGFDPAEQPDIYGKVGNAGVSIATIDDVAVLYDGFDLCAPSTSVSMTINGPAPAILAMYLNVAIDDHTRRFAERYGREPDDAERADLRIEALRAVRGTVQADILKEDQGQNTCIFSTDFALEMMADIQEWFVANEVRNFYSVSISGYHIAEAGANPISQLAFTLANAFTYVEAYLARGMDIDHFAPNLSFFFSSGMDPEYAVLGRVARRIWAVTMRDRYGANERSQKLKYHVQTSGRSLHAQEIAFNDIRTTLQALTAIYDNCNSLHTNAYDEAITTPTEESVRRAMAIQLIINREWGIALNENPLQGSFIIEELTQLVEDAVLTEFDRIDERGGVLGAMETGYQRGRIQDESMLYEQRKHDGSLPLIGVNTFRAADDAVPASVPLARSTTEEKQRQLDRLRDFQTRHAAERPAALDRLRQTALDGGNLFEILMDTVKVASLGEITQTLFEVGGRYRRNV